MSIKISKKTKGEVFSKTNNRCYYCGVALDFFNFPAKNAAVIDHVIPVSKGGKGNKENLVGSCNSCNGRKKDRDIKDFKDMIRSKSKEYEIIYSLYFVRANHSPSFSYEIEAIIDTLESEMKPILFYGETL